MNQVDFTATRTHKTFMRQPSIEGGNLTLGEDTPAPIKITVDFERAKYPLKGSVKEYKDPDAPMDWGSNE